MGLKRIYAFRRKNRQMAAPARRTLQDFTVADRPEERMACRILTKRYT